MRKGREENPFSASQAAAHTVIPILGWELVRTCVHFPVGRSPFVPKSGKIGVEGAVGERVGGDLIQPVGGERPTGEQVLVVLSLF